MPVRTAITVMLLAFAFGTFSAETTQSQLAKYGEQLADTWKVYPTEKDALARKQKMLDLTTAFTQDLKTLDAADNVTIKKALDDYRDNLLKSKTMFRQDK